MDEEDERVAIEFMRGKTEAVHVLDADALMAFNDGRGVFDVYPQGKRLENFIRTHSLDVERSSDSTLRFAHASLNNQPVYFGHKRHGQ